MFGSTDGSKATLPSSLFTSDTCCLFPWDLQREGSAPLKRLEIIWCFPAPFKLLGHMNSFIYVYIHTLIMFDWCFIVCESRIFTSDSLLWIKTKLAKSYGNILSAHGKVKCMDCRSNVSMQPSNRWSMLESWRVCSNECLSSHMSQVQTWCDIWMYVTTAAGL